MLKKNKKDFLNLNNKGFAITSIIYSMLLLFIILMTLIILTLGRKKVLIDKTKNATLDLFSQLDNYACVVTEKNANEIAIGVGDVITCKTENFYVVSNDGTNIEMLAKYNLNVGDNKIEGDTEGIQSTKAIGSTTNEKNATLAFSSTNYWSASTSYPTFVYNNNSALYQYVENYSTYLRDTLKIPELVSSLIDYNKLKTLGCTENSCTNAPSWVYLTSYWTGTAIDYQHIKYVSNNGNTTNSNDYSFASNFGVRPLVAIPTNRVKNKAPDVIKTGPTAENPPDGETGYTGVLKIVYLDPTDLTKYCDASNVKSDTETKTGCMKWYAYKDDETNGTYTMILDHNTKARIDNWNNRNSQLTNDTIEWDSSLNSRLITANEIDNITGNTNWTISSTSCYYLDSKSTTQTATSQGASKYSWLYDYTNNCINNGCNIEDSSTSGYWTSTPFFNNSDVIWYMDMHGIICGVTVDYALEGIRPVITVQKSLLNELD